MLGTVPGRTQTHLCSNADCHLRAANPQRPQPFWAPVSRCKMGSSPSPAYCGEGLGDKGDYTQSQVRGTAPWPSLHVTRGQDAPKLHKSSWTEMASTSVIVTY